MAANPLGPVWRGLAPYGPDDRDVFLGRDAACEELLQTIVGDGFRAGLLYGEPGVGKTSLLQAALLPRLAEQGVTIVACTDPGAPGESLAAALAETGARPTPGEVPSAYLARVVSNAPPGHLYLFVIDHIDRALGADDEQVVQELGELYARVLSRSSGRARFLFVCASERVHRLGHVERRTGSLFPPNCRFELERLPPDDAAAVLAASLGRAGVTVDPGLPDAVVAGLGKGGPILPAELQIALLGLRELRLTSAAALVEAGGGAELERHWLTGAARATTDERTGLRVLAEVADASPAPIAAATIGERLGLAPGLAEQVVAGFADRGAVVRGEGGWTLASPALAPRVRELAAPARVAARRAHELLAARTTAGRRLSPRELWHLRRENVVPTDDAERATLDGSLRFYKTVAIAVAALPVVLLIILWFLQSGRYYLDVAHRPGGDRIVVRGGRAGLSSFHWMPGSPGFGEVVADTGLSRSMVDPKAWKAVRAHDVGGDVDAWVGSLDRVLEPRLAALWRYAAGDQDAVETLGKLAKTPDERAEILVALRPIARGSRAEVELVAEALATPAPSVQHAAISVAGAAAQRNPDAFASYKDTLVAALTSDDAELRRIAITAVGQLGNDRAQALFTDAIARDPDPSIKRELLVEVSNDVPEAGPPGAESALPGLTDPDATPAIRERARTQLRRAFAADPRAAALGTVPLLADESAPAESRVFAIRLVLEEGDIGPSGEPRLLDAARTAFNSRTESVRAAAVPLYARVAPSAAVPDITRVSGERNNKIMRVAVALAWGELARAKIADAGPALEKLIRDESYEVRAAAAEAMGNLGRSAQEPLIKMIKNERLEVAAGAARGLARTAEVGAPISYAVGGIAQLWKRKGRSRREAVAVYASMARKRPGPVMNYLVAAVRATDDDALHLIGATGLCAAAAQGNPEARRQLLRVAGDPSVEVRRLVIACVADGPDAGKNGVAVATRVIRDSDPRIRAEAARVLAMAAAKGGKLSGGVGDALVGLLDDNDRDVRVIAIRAVGGLGADAPPGTVAALIRAFEHADEAEKILLLRAGRAVGATDLIGLAVADGSALVRVEAVDSALAAGVRAAATVSAALADADAQVRRAVLQRMATDKDKLTPDELERALALAVRDPDPDLRQLALTTLARVAPKDVVVARLGRALTSRTERERAQAAAAAIGLVERDAKAAVNLLTPLLADPSHDVRVAMLASLGSAYAAVNSPDQLAHLLDRSERDAMKRLAAAAAFIMLARTEAGRGAATQTLEKVGRKGPALARRTAKLALGLIESQADGIAFLEQLVP